MSNSKYEERRRALLRAIHAAGFKAYMLPGEPLPLEDPFAYYTDGTNIGYIALGARGFNVSTVHKPNLRTGTGFRVVTDATYIGKSSLEMGFFRAPHWASGKAVESAVKYKNFDDWHQATKWNSGYELQEERGT